MCSASYCILLPPPRYVPLAIAVQWSMKDSPFNVKKKPSVWGWHGSRICLAGGFPVTSNRDKHRYKEYTVSPGNGCDCALLEFHFFKHYRWWS